MLLSAFVRSSERPPLAFLAGWPYLLIGTVELTVAIWYLLPTLGLAGLLIHVGIGVPLLIVDALKSNHFGWNLVSLRANGFSDASVAFTVLFNLVASQGLTCLVFQYFGITAPLTLMTTTAAAESSPVGAWMGRAAAVAVNLCLTEAAFFVAHRELHLNPVRLILSHSNLRGIIFTGSIFSQFSVQLLAPLHLMHHACRWASNTTNLLFHPLDLALEFAGPYLCLVGMHAFLWHDPITLFISIYIVQMWCVA